MDKRWYIMIFCILLSPLVLGQNSLERCNELANQLISAEYSDQAKIDQATAIAQCYQSHQLYLDSYFYYKLIKHWKSECYDCLVKVDYNVRIAKLLDGNSLYDHAIDYYKNVDDSTSVYLNLAYCYRKIKQDVKAIEYYEKVYLQVLDNEKKIIALKELIHLYLQEEKLDEVYKLLQQNRYHQNTAYRLVSLKGLSLIAKRSSNYDKEITLLQEALLIAQSTKNEIEKAQIKGLLGVAYFEKDEISKAIDQIDACLLHARETDDKETLLSLLNYKAHIYLHEDQLKRVLQTLHEVDKLFDKELVNEEVLNTYKIYIKFYQLKGNKAKEAEYTFLLHSLEERLKQRKVKEKQDSKFFREQIDKINTRLAQFKHLSEVEKLKVKNLELKSESQEKELDLLSKDQALKEKELMLTRAGLLKKENEYTIAILSKQKKQKEVELLKKEIEEKQKKDEIKNLQQLNEQKQLSLLLAHEKLTSSDRLRNIYALLSILVLMLSVFIVYQLYHKKRRQQAKLEREKINTEKMLFRSQMNPHFLFNSLHSIKGMVLLNETKNANSYLTKFATLMRNILDHSSQNLISLQSEIETLKTYIELEQLRFKGKFEYSIQIDNEIEEESLYLPPMLLQPHIENAILHGLSKLEYKGILNICFKIDDKDLVCIIDDNGIGRIKSSQINHSLKRESKGIKIMNQHLVSISKEYKHNSSLTITDKPEHTGTIVQVHLPLIYHN